MFLQLIFNFSIQAGDWKAANEELTVSCRYVIKNQTTGDRLNIRVVAVNPGGRSPPATLADAVLVREVVGKSTFYFPDTLALSSPCLFHKLSLCVMSFFCWPQKKVQPGT